MKKLHVSAISILFAVLCLVFTACNQGIIAGNETGTVQVVIGGGGRAVDAAGMPVFDDTNTKITVTDENGNKLAEGTTSVTVNADIGTKITVKAVVTTAAGTWRGSVEHTVTAGTNIVAVKLSKTPKNMGNILSSVISQFSFGDAKVTFKLASGKELLNDVDIGSNHIIPVIARDGIGRIYVLYDKGGRHFTRFDAEGKKDDGFETAIKGILQGFDIGRIKTMTVDPKTGTIFVFNGASVRCLKETGHNAFASSTEVNLNTLDPSISTVSAVAAYNGTLFFTVPPFASVAAGMKNKLVAVKAELSGSSLTLTKKDEKTLPKLRPAGAFGNYPTNCTGLFADESGVYCLLSEQNLDSGTLYTLGQIVRYQYSGSAFTGETKIGLNPKAAGTDGIPFDSGSFSNPVGFIGSDEDYIYIADDGYNIEYLNENWRINGNKNRIAAFNRKTNEITFTDTDATWYGQRSEYKLPNTKILLWERLSSGAFRYWTSASGTDSFTSDNKLFESSTTDTFCYDQDGNLYILWNTGSNNYKVRRFELKDGSYKPGVDSGTIGSGRRTPRCIAVDISDGQNCLYYGNWDGSWQINKVSWTSDFTSLSGAGEITVPNITEDITALAVNKDGIFVDVKEDASVGTAKKYRLKVQKYAKTGSPTAPDKITLVDDAPRYTKETGEAIDDLSPITSAQDPYIECEGAINGLQVVDGVLYAITSRITKTMKYQSGEYNADAFSSGSSLYKVGITSTSFSGTAEKLLEKPANDTAKIGYGFYRFIAVKPKKLVIASDGAWGKDGISTHVKANNNKVFEYDLDKNLLSEKGDAGGTFSKELAVPGSSGFKWE